LENKLEKKGPENYFGEQKRKMSSPDSSVLLREESKDERPVDDEQIPIFRAKKS